MDNPWNVVSEYFDTYTDKQNLPEGTADNILIGWPPVVNCINKTIPQKTGMRALDYGCGAGEFCHTLRDMGFDVTGIDSAPRMIEVAQKHGQNGITYLLGDASVTRELPPFHAITSIMVLQFIPAIEETIEILVSALAPGGILLFEVFNPVWISACLQAKILFHNFDSLDIPTRGLLRVGGKVDVPIFVRAADEYNGVLTGLGMKKILEDYPPFTHDYLAQYPTKRPTSVSEYLVMGYQKPANA